MSSVGFASLIAHAAFWLLLAYGRLTGEVSPRGTIILALAWVAGLVLLPYALYGDALFSPLIAMLDIALVLIIFKGDVRLR
jgi:hypothetical protein